MQNISIEKASVNSELLDSEVKLALGDLIIGVSTGRGKVVVHLEDRASSSEISQATQLVEDHNPNLLTPDQQKKQEYKSKIIVGRETFPSPLDPTKVTLEQLATRMDWLETEIRELKGF